MTSQKLMRNLKTEDGFPFTIICNGTNISSLDEKIKEKLGVEGVVAPDKNIYLIKMDRDELTAKFEGNGKVELREGVMDLPRIAPPTKPPVDTPPAIAPKAAVPKPAVAKQSAVKPPPPPPQHPKQGGQVRQQPPLATKSKVSVIDMKTSNQELAVQKSSLAINDTPIGTPTTTDIALIMDRCSAMIPDADRMNNDMKCSIASTILLYHLIPQQDAYWYLDNKGKLCFVWACTYLVRFANYCIKKKYPDQEFVYETRALTAEEKKEHGVIGKTAAMCTYSPQSQKDKFKECFSWWKESLGDASEALKIAREQQPYIISVAGVAVGFVPMGSTSLEDAKKISIKTMIKRHYGLPTPEQARDMAHQDNMYKYLISPDFNPKLKRMDLHRKKADLVESAAASQAAYDAMTPEEREEKIKRNRTLMNDPEGWDTDTDYYPMEATNDGYELQQSDDQASEDQTMVGKLIKAANDETENYYSDNFYRLQGAIRKILDINWSWASLNTQEGYDDALKAAIAYPTSPVNGAVMLRIKFDKIYSGICPTPKCGALLNEVGFCVICQAKPSKIGGYKDYAKERYAQENESAQLEPQEQPSGDRIQLQCKGVSLTSAELPRDVYEGAFEAITDTIDMAAKEGVTQVTELESKETGTLAKVLQEAPIAQSLVTEAGFEIIQEAADKVAPEVGATPEVDDFFYRTIKG